MSVLRYFRILFWLVRKCAKLYIALNIRMFMADLPTVAFEKIMKSEGASRVSPKAYELLRKHVEHRICEIAREAKIYAKHANRKTILADDVLLVLKK
jgi:histone H3/H4